MGNHLLFFESLSTFFLLLTELSIRNLCWGTALRKTASVDSSLLRGTADIVCMTGVRERALYTMNAMCFEDINTNVVPFGGILFMVYVCSQATTEKSHTPHLLGILIGIVTSINKYCSFEKCLGSSIFISRQASSKFPRCRNLESDEISQPIKIIQENWHLQRNIRRKNGRWTVFFKTL